MSPSGTSPCAACKLLRRRCAKDCVFAPYFPPDEPQKFSSVHKVFGASNVNKMLQDLPVHQRGDAVSSMVYEANARMRDPVYGCVGAISALQQQVAQLQTQLAVLQAEMVVLRMQQSAMVTNIASSIPIQGNAIKISIPAVGSPPAAPSSPDINQQIRPQIAGMEGFDIAEPLWST